MKRFNVQICRSILVILAVTLTPFVYGCQSGVHDADEGEQEKAEQEKTEEEKEDPGKSGEPGSSENEREPHTAQEIEAVRKTFQDFSEAVSQRDGKAAIELVSSNSVARYARVRELALAGAERKRLDEIRESPLGDRVMIAMMLLRLGEERLRPLSGEELFIIGIQQGWIGRRSFEDAELGDVTVMENGVMATSPLVVEGEEQDASWRFVKEDGQWKLDLTALMHFADVQMREAAKKAGFTEDELVKKIVEDSDNGSARDIWLPWSPPDGGFRVSLPAPARAVERKDAAGSDTKDGEQYWLSRSMEQNAAYMINVSPVGDAPESPAEITDNAIRGVVASSGGELVGVAGFEQRGIQGKQIQLKMPENMLLSGRVFVHEGKLYQMLVMSEANLGLQHLDRFFGSFVIKR